MKKLIYIWIFMIAMPSVLVGQGSELVEQAYLMYKKDSLSAAATLINQYVNTKNGSTDSKAWHMRGFIYKNIYIKLDGGEDNLNSTAREEALKSFKKSVVYDEGGEYAEQNTKALQYLARTYWNNLSDIIAKEDPNTIDDANEYYLTFKETVVFTSPDVSMKERDVKFNLAMYTGHRKIYERDRVEYKDHWDKSNEYLKVVLEIDPENFSANYSMGVSHYNHGAYTLEKLPETEGIIDMYEIMHEGTRSIELALPFMLRAYEIDSTKIEVVKGLRIIYFNLNKEEQSKFFGDREKELREQQVKE